MKNFSFPIFLLLVFVQSSCAQKKSAKHSFPIQKSEDEWKASLSSISYYVLRKAGTERPFTGAYNKFYEKGIYHCMGCQQPLYDSDHKYDSKSGWPSFDRAIKGAVVKDVDYKLGYGRAELLCARCGGHLGHVFDDGPVETTGQRHCINSAALEFKAYKSE